MGNWDTVVSEEFDGHLVVVEVRRSDFEMDVGQDDNLASVSRSCACATAMMRPEWPRAGRQGWQPTIQQVL